MTRKRPTTPAKVAATLRKRGRGGTTPSATAVPKVRASGDAVLARRDVASPPGRSPRASAAAAVPGVEPDAAVLIRQARFASARAAFASDAELAQALGADRSRAARWKAGEPMDDARWRHLEALDITVALLRGWLEPATIPKWLHGLNAHLGHRRPLDVLRDGRLSEVVAAIEAEKSGAFA
jgi:hypothetical protein